MKAVVVIGTRPEAIKLAPVVRELRSVTSWQVEVCATGQHQAMLAAALQPFEISADVNLESMHPGQTLSGLASAALERLGTHFGETKPDLVLVQGDTISTFAASLAAFYAGCRVGHVEAGLRTEDISAPWPEEANRRLTTQLTDWHFAPTESARANLRRESIPDDQIYVTGNTVIDALKLTLNSSGEHHVDALRERLPFLSSDRRLVLATLHRRENHNGGVGRVCRALRQLAQRGDVEILFPVHPNPASSLVVKEVLGGVEHVHLVEPLGYCDFVAAMRLSHLIVSDSGGVQEEAPYLGVPVLVTRDTTERPEAVECGAARLVGTNIPAIVQNCHQLLDNGREHQKMAAAASPFGDGRAAARIVDVLKGAHQQAHQQALPSVRMSGAESRAQRRASS